MASGIFILDPRGKPLIQRVYRGDVTGTQISDIFIQKVLDEEECNIAPVFEAENMTFIWSRTQSQLYFVIVTRQNVNLAIYIVFLQKIVELFMELLGSHSRLSEELVRNNFVMIYELLDEVMDFGVPQMTDSKLLRQYITQDVFHIADLVRGDLSSVISKAPPKTSGTVPWRSTGLKYRRNEAFLDVVESINLLVSSSGDVISCDVAGALKMKTALSGMPKVSLGLNDKISMDKRAAVSGGDASGPTRAGRGGVLLEDVTFHQCVSLEEFEAARAISFIPPDGSFTLMQYRVSTANIKPPILIDCRVERHGASRIEYSLRVKANFKKTSNATNLVVTIPVPPDAAKPTFAKEMGSCKYVPDTDSFVWNIGRLASGQDARLLASHSLPSIRSAAATTSLYETNASRRSVRPITVQFEIPYLASSGFQVRYLKVVENSLRYETSPWVRYIAKAGTYAFRLPDTVSME